MRWEFPYKARIPQQAAFHQARQDDRMRYCLAGTGAGKTYSGCAEASYLSLRWPDQAGVACQPTYKMVKRNLIPAFEDLWQAREISWEELPFIDSWNKSDLEIRFVNGSRCWLISLDEPEHAEGPTLNWFWMDELRVLRKFEECLDILMNRLRRDGYQGGWGSTHSPTKPVMQALQDDGALFQWTTQDALEAGVISEAYYESMANRYSGSKREAVLEGKHARPEGLVFEPFDPHEHVRDAPDPDEVVNAGGGVDWGWTNESCALLALETEGRVHIVEVHYASFTSTERMAEKMIEAEEMYGVRGQATWRVGHDQPQEKKRLQKEGLSVETRPVGADEGLQTVLEKVEGDEVTVDAEAENLQAEMNTATWDESKQKETIAEEERHAIDALVYALVKEERTGLAFGTV